MSVQSLEQGRIANQEDRLQSSKDFCLYELYVDDMIVKTYRPLEKYVPRPCPDDANFSFSPGKAVKEMNSSPKREGGLV
ncbi:conserved hypothetical protein [Ricinus communis]|uniref:Uncharacterized protein n=1 Tax=Ricinus communis TaxID=3988 RepID=B9RRJ4_RICCO|nr:conserved hypothetical protein [Ricinus communis]